MHNPLLLYSSRLLAASLDLIVVQTLCRFISPLLNENFNFFSITNFLITGLYFVVAHSNLLNGQTPGKLLFGLRIYDIKTKSLLSFKKSFLRYLIFPGSIILLSEVPASYYRSSSLVASPFILELPMLFALSLFLITTSLFFLSPQRKALQDWLTSTIVVREAEQNLEQELKTKTSWKAKQSLGALVALLLASMLWLYGLNSPKSLSDFTSYKYFLEAKSKKEGNEFRIAGSTVQNGTTIVALFFTKETTSPQIIHSLKNIIKNLDERGYNFNSDETLKFLCQTSEGERLEFLRDKKGEFTEIKQN